MECVVASTTSRFDGQWRYKAHVGRPLHPGVSIEFKAKTYVVGTDMTLEVLFPASNALDAQAIAREIGAQLNAEGKSIVHSREENVAALLNELRRCDRAINRACEAGFLGDAAVSDVFAAYLVDQQVKKALPKLSSCVRVGDGNETGYFDQTGKCHAHCWVEVSDGTSQWVADIGAEQFGGEAFIILPLSQAEDNYYPAADELAREQVFAFEMQLKTSMPSADAFDQDFLANCALKALLADD